MAKADKKQKIYLCNFTNIFTDKKVTKLGISADVSKREQDYKNASQFVTISGLFTEDVNNAKRMEINLGNILECAGLKISDKEAKLIGINDGFTEIYCLNDEQITIVKNLIKELNSPTNVKEEPENSNSNKDLHDILENIEQLDLNNTKSKMLNVLKELDLKGNNLTKVKNLINQLVNSIKHKNPTEVTEQTKKSLQESKASLEYLHACYELLENELKNEQFTKAEAYYRWLAIINYSLSSKAVNFISEVTWKTNQQFRINLNTSNNLFIELNKICKYIEKLECNQSEDVEPEMQKQNKIKTVIQEVLNLPKN